MKRIVIALGGNALGATPQEQLRFVKSTAKSIVALAKENVEIVIGHGNGPQVGMIHDAFSVAQQTDLSISQMPFPECVAMSQGYIGYHLQQAVINELQAIGSLRNCASIITQVLVDKHDPAFTDPSKPIGPFLPQEEAEEIMEKQGYQFMEDAGRGFRRVVPSPKPLKIVELPIIDHLLQQQAIVVTVGGGGIPVIETKEGYQGIAAVIDKDYSSAQLAIDLQADILVILTVVQEVYLHYNQPEQRALKTSTSSEMRTYLQKGYFGRGSMAPKIEACLSFVEKTDGIAMIASLDQAMLAVKGDAGTKIIRG